ncbi:DMT family transporter [Candidatus Roizmanbacteria bacterium]|nr:DMT family transporter [Candidatus Roizmanbacteria bacterium]
MQTQVLSILAGLGGMIGWGTSDFFAGLFSKKIGYLKTLFWSQMAGLLFASSFILFFPFSWNMSFLILFLLPVSAVIFALAYLLFYRALEIGSVAIISATLNLWGVFTPLIAFLFLGQRLSGYQTVGICMIMFGVLLTSLKWSDLKLGSVKLLAGIKETVLSAFLFGIFWNLSDIISKQIGWLSTTLFIKIGVLLFLIAYSLIAGKKMGMVKTTAKTKLMVALVGILEAIAVMSVNFGLTVGRVILVSPISSALSIITITLAVIFLKDKITGSQVFGMVLAVLGIALTAFS